MSRMKRGLVLLAATLVVQVGPRRAVAEGPDAAIAEADREFNRGRALWESEPAAACGHFRASMALDPSPTVLVFIGTCEQREGKARNARADYRQAALLNEKVNAPRVQHQKALEKRIAENLKKLEASAPRLDLRVTPRPERLEVWLDDELISVEELGEPIMVNDVGAHRISVKAPGYRDVTTSGEGLVTVTLERVPETEAKAPASPEPTVAPTVAPPTEARAEPATARESRAFPPHADRDSRPLSGGAQRTVGYVTGGLGIAALGVAGFLGLRTLALVDRSEGHCFEEGCDDYGYNRLVKATQTQTAGFVVGASGLALAIIGTVLVGTAPGDAGRDDRSGRPRRTGRSIAFRAGPTSVELVGSW